MSGAVEVSLPYSLFLMLVWLLTCCSTPLLQDWLGDDKPKRFRREVHFPTGRFGEAIEQAHAVVFLASDESSFVNGSDFVVDGGMSKVCVPLITLDWSLLTRCKRRMLLQRDRPPPLPRTWGIRHSHSTIYELNDLEFPLKFQYYTRSPIKQYVNQFISKIYQTSL